MSDVTLLDTHCHLTDYDNPMQVLRDAADAAVTVVAVTEDPSQYRLLRTRLGRNPHVRAALGIHPLAAHRATAHDIVRFHRLVPDAAWIGEIGLDFSSHGQATRREQLRVFEELLTDTHLRTKPVTVHSRGAEKDIVAKLAQAQIPAILHWYTGPLSLVDDALAAGMRFSINTAMAATEKGRALLAVLPRTRVLLESDGPYARHAGRASRPTDLLWVVDRLATTWSCSKQDAHAQITATQHGLERTDP